MDYEEILKRWGFEEYVEKFKDQEINDVSFNLLDEDTIKEIFTKKGPYLVFKAKYKEFRERRNEIIIYNDLETISNASTTSNESTVTLTSNESDVDISNPIHSNLVVITPEEELENMLKNFSDHQNNSSDANFLIPDIPPAKKSRIENSVFTKHKTLEELLLKSGAEGLSILAKKKKLSPDLRQKLVNIVVGELCADIISNRGNVELKPIVFSRAAKEICSFFPEECEDVYYIPYISGKGGLRRVPTRGKLWSRYLTIKAQLRLLNKEKNRIENTGQTVEETDPDTNKDLEFLKENDAPFPRILEVWENTFEERRKLLAKKENPVDFISSFKCLQVDNGILLLEADFNRIYSEKIDIVYKNWPKVAEAIIFELKERGVHLGEYSEFDITSQALLQLTFMFSTVNIRKNKENWRPSRAEVKDSFFFKLNVSTTSF
ncbi:uncharacterized protein LOC123313249 isoform X2 [Coccinella septempunctata]|uniref:uncharacterized protein LOC123313249 isoform X2 n=1 Tax=Coccinella septempunctata TaxID=41139 RepID=UPI001D06F773|nr:uncharacterized protein LOC123313249 isoform X2 [Coccinella septempunctata]